MSFRSKITSRTVIYYLLIFSGLLLFSSLKVSLIQTITVFLLNQFIAALFKKEEPAVQTILSLALFGFLYIAATALLGQKYFIAVALLIFINGIFFSAKKSKDKKAVSSINGSWQLAAFLLIVLLTLPPFLRVGKKTASGFAYRAYFSSDYLKHYAVCQQLNNGSLPPQNPYFSGRDWNYYWFAYSFAAFSTVISEDVENSVKGWSFLVNFNFLLLLFLLLKRVIPTKRILVFLLVLLPFACSLEGLLFLQKNGLKALPGFSKINIDALTRWWYQLPEINTLYRALLYTPQHLLSLALILIFLLNRTEEKERLFQGTILSLSLLSSFFLGGVFILFIFFWQTVDFIARLFKRDLPIKKTLFDNCRIFLPALIGLILIFFFRMSSSASGSFIYLKIPAIREIFLLLFLNFGLALTLALLALFAVREQELTFARAGLLYTLLLIIFLRWRGFENDFSLKIGLLTIVFIAMLSAALLQKLKQAAGIFFALLIITSGLPTLSIDLYNSSDISNRQFTSFVSFDEKRALNFLRSRLKKPATVALLADERSTFFSLIPSFTRHRLYLGDRMHSAIFQIHPEDQSQRRNFLEQELSRLPYSTRNMLEEKIELIWWSDKEKEFFRYQPHNLHRIFKSGTVEIFCLQ